MDGNEIQLGSKICTPDVHPNVTDTVFKTSLVFFRIHHLI